MDYSASYFDVLYCRVLQTHASVPADQRVVLGISDTLIRLSVGLEDVEDLIEDIDKALKAAVSGWFNSVCVGGGGGGGAVRIVA